MTNLTKFFLQAIKELVGAPNPCWYNINVDHSSPFDLWNALSLTPQEFQCVLVELGWVSVRTTGRDANAIRFKPKEIERYIVSFLDKPYKCELDKKKTKFFGVQMHFLRLGAFKDSPFSAGDQFDNGWLNGYQVCQMIPIASMGTIQKLKSSITQHRIHQTSSEENDLAEETIAAPTDPKFVPIAPNETFMERLSGSIELAIASFSWTDLLMLWGESKDTLADAFAEVLIRNKHQTKAKRNEVIFGPASSDVPNKHETMGERPKTPKLAQYNIPDDVRERELIFRELLLLKQRSNRSCRVGSVLFGNGVSRAVVIVPKSGRPRVSEELVKVILDASELNVGSLVAICCRIDKEAFVAALQAVKLAPPGRLSVEQLAGMMKKANLSQGQMRVIRRFLHEWLHCKIFPSEHHLLTRFAQHGFAPYVDIAMIDGHDYYYSYKLPDELLEFHLVRYLEQSKADVPEARALQKIELVILADHGKGAFRMICSFLYYKANQLVFKEHASCGNVEITEDSVRAMRLTFVSKVNESLRKIEQAGNVVLRGEKDSFIANLGNRDDEESDEPVVTVIPVTCYLNGDIKFLANCLGKERMAGKHCYKCRLSPKEWAQPSHTRGIPWCQPTLKAKWEEVCPAETAGQRLPPAVVRGVTGPAIIDSIPVCRVGIPQLHLELDMGNQVLYKRILRDYVVPLFVRLNDDVYEARRAFYITTKAVVVAEDCATSTSDTLKRLAKEQSTARKRLTEALTKVKYLKDPIVIHIEQQILLKYNIKRSSYHGGDPEGTACRALFANANNVMNDLASYLRGLQPVFPGASGNPGYFRVFESCLV